MSITIKLKRGVQTAIDSYTGTAGELVYDTTNNALRIHNGSTVGGITIPNKATIDNTYLNKQTGGTVNGDVDLGTHNITANRYLTTRFDNHFEFVGKSNAAGYYLDNHPDGTSWHQIITTVGGQFINGSLGVGGNIWKPTGVIASNKIDGGLKEILVAADHDGTYGALLALRSMQDKDLPGGWLLATRNGSTDLGPTLQANKNGEMGQGGTAFSVSGGTIQAGGFQISSDKRLKSNIKPIENGLEKVTKLNGYTFTMNNLNVDSAGLIAQELEQVLPDAVSQNDDGYKTINYSAVIGLLVEAIKQMNQKIDSLK